ncbi:hypothetical protein ACHMW6_00215 (plasmid) [Pseudoduganella sp. UC29_106]|uniref:hypothetical protein n=1 Tax=Pseudoduganella sp. UC29_106 TaxID=3374553 RepID=UPI003756D09C
MRKNLVDPFVFTKKTVFMQRLSDLVRSNHSRYILGTISIDKAPYFAAKMDLNYSCFANKVTAHRERQRGNASSRLLFLSQENTTHLTWVLLVTEGKWQSPYAGNEKWLDPIEDRITISGYELVRHIRSGNAKPSWTWRYTGARYDELRNMVVMAIRRHRADELRNLIDSLWRSPAFAGVREQIKKFAQLIKAEWTRSGVGDMPEIPKGLGFVRRLPDKGKKLSMLIKEAEIGNS